MGDEVNVAVTLFPVWGSIELGENKTDRPSGKAYFVVGVIVLVNPSAYSKFISNEPDESG